MKEYIRHNRTALIYTVGIFAAAALVLVAAVVFNDAGGAASVLM